jgi:hypothetical protein
MLEKTFGLLFYLKPARNQKEQFTLRLPANYRRRQVAELSTKKLWNTERWNSSVGRPAGQKEDAKTLNAYLGHAHCQSLSGEEDSDEDDKEISAEGLLKMFCSARAMKPALSLKSFSAIMSKWKHWSARSSRRSL